MGVAVFEGCDIAVITHATKTLPELGRSDVLAYPGAPKTELLLKVVDNLKRYTGLKAISIVFDHKVDCAISCAYLDNLRLFCQEQQLRLLISPSALAMPSQQTATHAFHLAGSASESTFLMLWEHDHLFHEAIDWDRIQKAMDHGAAMIRFNRRPNSSVQGSVPETVQACDFSADLCQTDYYCNGPFIARRSWLQPLFDLALREPPTWNGCFGGFVEGPINRAMLADRYNRSDDEYRSLYPIYLYGGLDAVPIVSHFGEFLGRKGRFLAALRRAGLWR